MRLLRNVVLAAGAAALVVCAGTQANAEEDPLVIGIAKSSTGFMSAYDMPAKLGIEFAIDDINAEGGLLGRKLTSIWRDTKDRQGSGGDRRARADRRRCGHPECQLRLRLWRPVRLGRSGKTA